MQSFIQITYYFLLWNAPTTAKRDFWAFLTLFKMLPLTKVRRDSFWCFVLSAPLRITPVSGCWESWVTSQGKASWEPRVAATGAGQWPRQLGTAPQRGSGAAQAAERWHRQLLSTVLQPAGQVTSQVHRQPRKPEQQPGNRTGTGTPTTFLQPWPKAWARDYVELLAKEQAGRMEDPGKVSWGNQSPSGHSGLWQNVKEYRF